MDDTVVWGYDDFFRLTSRTVNSSSAYEVAYTYDNDNFVSGTSLPDSTFSITRSYANLNGRVTNTRLENITDTTSYDGFGAVASYTAYYNSTVLYSFTIPSTGGRDLNGRILSMTETINGTNHSWTFTYDQNGQLLTAKRDSTTNTYVYDGNGNRTSLNGVT
jgi:YD repeat-containing protein